MKPALGIEGVADWQPPSAELLADLRQLAAALIQHEADKRGRKARQTVLETAKAGGDLPVRDQAEQAASEARRSYLAAHSGEVDAFATRAGEAVSYYQASKDFHTQHPTTDRYIEKHDVVASLRQFAKTLATLERQLETMPAEARRFLDRANTVGQSLDLVIPLAASAAAQAVQAAGYLPDKATDLNRQVLAREIATLLREIEINPTSTDKAPFRQALELCLHHIDPDPIPPTESLAKRALI